MFSATVPHHLNLLFSSNADPSYDYPFRERLVIFVE
jgi:hypothetical protein